MGLAIFVAGVVLLFSISSIHVSLHYVSLAVLLCGFAYSMWGYLGIFLQRFAALKNAKRPPKF
jgi:hypothetical protein